MIPTNLHVVSIDLLCFASLGCLGKFVIYICIILTILNNKTTDGLLNRGIATRIKYIHICVEYINEPDEFAQVRCGLLCFASLGCLGQFVKYMHNIDHFE